MDAAHSHSEDGRLAARVGAWPARGWAGLRRLSERTAFPGDSLVLLALLLLANLLRIHFPGGAADLAFAAVALLMGLTLLRGGVQAGAWPVLFCFAALFALYGVSLLFAFSLQGVRHWAAIPLAGLVFLFCHRNGPALTRSKGVIPVLLLALLLLAPLYFTSAGINAHTLAAILGYLVLAVGLVAVVRGDGGRRQHWWAHLFFLLFVVNGVIFGHRALVGGLLLAYPLYWAGRRLLRSWRGAWLLTGMVAAAVWLIMAVLVAPLPVGAASYIDRVFQGYTGGKVQTGRQTLWGAALAGMAEAPWLGKGAGAVIHSIAMPQSAALDGAPAQGNGAPPPAAGVPQGEGGAAVISASAEGRSCLNDANPRLVMDCNVLIGLRSTLEGDSGALWSWDYTYPISSWRGVTLGGQPPRVTGLDLSWLSSLNGRIPPEIAQLDQLTTLNLSYNALIGAIPPELGRLANLELLALDQNALSGPIPAELGLLDKLGWLFLDANRLSGAIPAELGELPQLQKLMLAGNELSGPFPAALRHLPEHDLDQNLLCLPPNESGRERRIEGRERGEGAGAANAGLLRDCAALLAAQGALDADGRLNWRPTTPIPSWRGVVLGQAPLRVTQLRLSGMGLGGELPRELGALEQLEQLSVDRNRLTGPIPPEMGRLAKLREFTADYNALTGPIPPQLGNLPELRELWLGENRLTGPIPATLGAMRNLERLGLRNNRLAGAVPPGVRNVRHHDLNDLLCMPPAGLPAGWVSPGLLQDCAILLAVRGALAATRGLSWSRDVRLSKWEGVILGGEPLRVVALALEGRGLSGQIPAELGGLERLVSLNLAHNQLTGPIPAELTRLRGLVLLSLHNNRLSGGLPPELLRLPRLEALNYLSKGFDGPPPLLQPRDGNGGQAADWFCLPSSARPPGPGLLADCALLLEMRDLLAGGAELNWRKANPIGAWRGVVLGGAPPRIVGLHLDGAGLRGRIPAQLAGLGRLESLRLGGNSLTGPIPAALGGLRNLGDLRLGGGQRAWDADALRNGLFCLPLPRVGPSLLNDCEALLALRDVLAGGASLNWRRTTPLHAWDGVQLDGAPPRIVGLDLEGRRLSGRLPAGLAALDRLRELHLSRNRLKGGIPAELTELALLRSLRLAGNAFTGAPPPALRKVRRHDLDDERFCRPSGGAGASEANPRLLKDCALLLSLRDALAGAADLNWRRNRPIGAWQGVKLGGAEPHVQELHLSGMGLLGELPPELGGLAGLQVLDLEGNVLGGAIPPQLGNLGELRALRLRGNRLRGPVPRRLAALRKLSQLRLGGNDFSGPIPEALRRVADRDLALRHDRDLALRHECPLVRQANFGLRDDCANLLAMRGALAGTAYLNWSEAAPMSAWDGVVLGGEPQRVVGLNLSRMGLNGRIPGELGRLGQLAELRLNGNSLAGPIPAELQSLGNLRVLRLNQNQLAKPAPPGLGAWPQLADFDLRNDALQGGPSLLPEDALGIAGDALCQPSPAKAAEPDAGLAGNHSGLLKDCSALLAVRDALAGGAALNWSPSTPVSLWRGVQLAGAPPRVVALNLTGAGLKGRIPAGLAALDQLGWLRLSDNRLTGPIPPELGRLSNLVELALQDNDLTGGIPPQLQQLTSLEELWLGNNRLTGEVPPELGRLEPLWVLRLIGNDFSGCLGDSLRRFGTSLHHAFGLVFCGEEANSAEEGIGAAIQALNEFVDPSEGKGMAKSAHNLFLQIGLQTGIVGLLLLALLCASLILGVRSRHGGEVTPVQRFVATCIVMVIIQNVFEVYLLQNLLSVGICSWILIGMGMGAAAHPGQPDDAAHGALPQRIGD